MSRHHDKQSNIESDKSLLVKSLKLYHFNLRVKFPGRGRNVDYS